MHFFTSQQYAQMFKPALNYVMLVFFQILSNGAIGFDSKSRGYKRDVFTPEGSPIIAAFWNRNDMRKGGHIYYREITSKIRLILFSLYI